MALEMKYFILKPKAKTRNDPFAKASQMAMDAYANAIEDTDSKFAEQLREWVEKESVNQFALDK